MNINAKCTLEDFYNGKEMDIKYTRQTICPHCRGSGADDPDDVQECPDCGGKGYTI